jgi:hypothetical protein
MIFSKIELKHLKYKMMNERGMSSDEANKQIQQLIETAKANHSQAKSQGKEMEAQNSQPKNWEILKRQGRA